MKDELCRFYASRFICFRKGISTNSMMLQEIISICR